MAYTPPVLPPLNPVASGPAAVGQQQNPPLPALPAGAVLQGTVSGQDASGNVIIKTDTLQLVLNTQYPLQKGAQVAVRLDHTLTAHLQQSGQSAAAQPRIQQQPVQILSVDGKTAMPQPAATPANAQSSQVQTPAPQSELAKPVGILLDMLNRSGAAKPAGGEAAQQTSATAQQQAPVRGAAAEVMLSEGVRATAVLLRPSLAPQAAQILQQLAAQTPMPLPNPSAALRPGLQLQVQVVQTQATQSAAAPPSAQPPVSVSGAGQAAIPAAASAVRPSATAAVPPSPAVPSPTGVADGTQPAPTQPPTSPLSTYTAPPSPQAASGYASYAKQVPAMISGSPPPAAGYGQTPAGQTPAQSTAPAQASPQAPTSTVVPQPASVATPVNIPQHLTPQVVEQLLARAEAQPMPQGQMAAVVMGKEPSGQMIVQTRLGMFSLPQVQAESLQPGNVVTWQVRAALPPQMAQEALPMPSATALSAATQMTGEWSAMSELATAMQSMQGTAAAHMQRVIPHVGSNMGAGLMLFVSMMRKGDVTEWLGKDVMEQLDRMGKADLVPRLGADMAAVRSLFVDQPQGNWQALFFPVMVDKQLQHAQMFVKPDEQGDKKQGGGGMRFVVEVELSNLGAMQIDGFVRKREAATQFDLVLRTLNEFPDAMKTDIYEIFEKAQGAAGFNGSLNFRRVHEFPVHPLEEMEAGKGGNNGGGVVA